MPFEERLTTNDDHPLAIDNDLFITHVKQLLNYEQIEKPVYDYGI